MKAKVLSDNTRGTIHFISVITHARCDKSACFHYYTEQNIRALNLQSTCNIILSLISEFYQKIIKIYSALYA